MGELRPSDLIAAADSSIEALRPHTEGDWRALAGDLDWTCRRTLDHIVDALAFYCAHLATRASARLPFTRDGAPSASIDELITCIGSQAAVLARVCEASGGVRAFHSAGMADSAGFVAMGCDEILVHTNDVCAGLGVSFEPPADLCSRVVARLFPWAPNGFEPWATLLWCNGRIALPDHERLGPEWWWWCRPLDEWDGVAYTRTQPPAWT